MNLLVAGVCHRAAGVPLLERLAALAHSLPDVYARTLARERLGEALVLSTCNRVEVYAAVSAFHEGLAELGEFLAERAGLLRLGRAAEATEILDPSLMLPAPVQGALAVERRDDDTGIVELPARLDDPVPRAAVTAERSFLAALGAGCRAPVAALAEIADGDDGPKIHLRGAVFSPDGRTATRLARTGRPAEAAEVGQLLAADLSAENDTVLGSTG